MRRLSLLVVCAVLMGAGTVALGWWTVPLVAGLWGLRGRAADAALAGLVAWSALLAAQATRAPLGALLDRLSTLFGIPGWLLVALTPIFAALLAWSAATLTATAARRGTPLGGRA